MYVTGCWASTPGQWFLMRRTMLGTEQALDPSSFFFFKWNKYRYMSPVLL